MAFQDQTLAMSQVQSIVLQIYKLKSKLACTSFIIELYSMHTVDTDTQTNTLPVYFACAPKA